METSPRQYEETALRQAILSGSEAAWTSLYERTFSPLYGYVYCRAGRDRQRTDEVVQQVWLVAVRWIADFDPARGAFETWLRGIAENVLRDDRRRAGRERSETFLEERDGARPAPPAGELTELIALSYTALPARYRAVLRAKYEEHLSLAEIAARWGETHKAVESLLSRARAAFRRAYEELSS